MSFSAIQNTAPADGRPHVLWRVFNTIRYQPSTVQPFNWFSFGLSSTLLRLLRPNSTFCQLMISKCRFRNLTHSWWRRQLGAHSQYCYTKDKCLNNILTVFISWKSIFFGIKLWRWSSPAAQTLIILELNKPVCRVYLLNEGSDL